MDTVVVYALANMGKYMLVGYLIKLQVGLKLGLGLSAHHPLPQADITQH